MLRRRKSTFKLRDFRRLFVGIFTGLLLLETLLLVIAMRERQVHEISLSDQLLLLQAREAIDTELAVFSQLSDLALTAARSGDKKQAKAHEDLAASQFRNNSASTSQNSFQLMAADIPLHLQLLQGGDAHFQPKEFSALEMAIKDAQELLKSDRKALHAIRGLFPDTDGEFTVRGQGDQTQLLALLTDESSAKKREVVRKTLSAFIAALDVRMYASVEKNASAIRQYSRFLSVVLGILLLSTASSGFILYQNIRDPLHSFKVHSRKINDDLARTLAQLETVIAERDILRKGAGIATSDTDLQPRPTDSLTEMP